MADPHCQGLNFNPRYMHTMLEDSHCQLCAQKCLNILDLLFWDCNLHSVWTQRSSNLMFEEVNDRNVIYVNENYCSKGVTRRLHISPYHFISFWLSNLPRSQIKLESLGLSRSLLSFIFVLSLSCLMGFELTTQQTLDCMS